MCDIIDSKDGYQRLQQELDQLGKRGEEWLMEFNTDKCEVLNFGKSNQGWTFSEWQSPGECCTEEASQSAGTWFPESDITSR